LRVMYQILGISTIRATVMKVFPKPGATDAFSVI